MYAAVLHCSTCLGKVFEATLLNLNTLSVQHWSYQLRSTSNNRDIEWDSHVSETEGDGDIDPCQMRSILNNAASKFKFIFALGEENRKTLENILNNRKYVCT